MFNARSGAALGNEAHLHFAEARRIVFELRIDVPGEHHALWRLPHQHVPPFAFGAVFAALVPAPADARSMTPSVIGTAPMW
jgi:hypothetical protein